VHFWPNLTQFLSRQQTDHFLAYRDHKNGHFRLETKIYESEMKPPQKPVHRALRMVMSQKMMCFAFAWQRKDREKRLNAAWKIYESGRFHSNLSLSLFQSAFKRFARIYMSRKNELN
jgi:hypothetical protein